MQCCAIIVHCYLAAPLALCTFEDANLCGFKQSQVDDLDWTQQSRSTASASTGPSNDHTYGTARGTSIVIPHLLASFTKEIVLNFKLNYEKPELDVGVS